jgi:hypothetical protein
MDTVIYILCALCVGCCWLGRRKLALIFFAVSFLFAIAWFIHHLTSPLSISL